MYDISGHCCGKRATIVINLKNSHGKIGYPPKPGQAVKSMAWIALMCIVSKAKDCPALDR